MKHLALYRKYRPTTFKEVIGQDHIVKTLQNQVESGQISHAYLFYGTRGVGKTSIAKIFAKAINCKEPKNGSPCMKCEVCKSLDDPSNLDVMEIDAASNNRVDEVRDLREKIKYTPINGKYKVYIIDEVHMLTDSAFNALLKTLEEPPSHAVFILATTEVHKLPATILSRVMRFDFKLVSLNDLTKLMQTIFEKQGIKADAESLKAMAMAGEGSVRDTLSVADVCASYSDNDITYTKVLEALGLTTKTVLLSLTDAIIRADISKLLTTIDTLFNQGKNLGILAKDLTTHFRDLLLIKTVKDANDILHLPTDLFEQMSVQAQKEEVNNLLFYMQVLSAVEGELRYTSNERLLLETATLSCIKQNPYTLEGLEKRLQQLEKGVVPSPIKKSERPLASAPVVQKESAKHTQAVAQKAEQAKPQIEDAAQQIDNEQLTKLWGTMLLDLSAEEYPVLYAAIIDAKPVKLQNDVLSLEVASKAVQSALSKKENMLALQKLFEKQGINVKIELILKQKTKSEDQTQTLLKQKFGDLLKITD